MEKLKKGSHRSVTYRGETISIWAVFLYEGNRPPRLRWKVGQLPGRLFPDEQQASEAGQVVVDHDINGPPSIDERLDMLRDIRRRRYEFFNGWPSDEDAEETDGTSVDLPRENASLKEKLERMTVERGATPAEAETARRKLEELDRKSR